MVGGEIRDGVYSTGVGGISRLDRRRRVAAHLRRIPATNFGAIAVNTSTPNEIIEMDRAECALALRQLGSAERSLDLYWGEEVIPGAQLVFASKGTAAGVIPETGIIVALTVFPPCTVDEYVASYQVLDLAREFRTRRD